MTEDTVLKQVDADGVCTITLNRPERLNALTDPMVQRLHDTMQEAAADRAVRVIVLTGAGRAFCTGQDVEGMGAQTVDEALGKLRRPYDHSASPDFQGRHNYLPAIPKPVIAAINGPVVGIGLLYAMTCDIRFASADAILTTGYARLGFGDEYGAGWFLRHAVGQARAMELMLSARKIRGEEAARLGLAHFAVPADELMDRVRAYARDMATQLSPQSFAFIKREMWEGASMGLAESVRMTNRDMRFTFPSAEVKEGRTAFLEKRAPRFAPWEGELP